MFISIIKHERKDQNRYLPVQGPVIIASSQGGVNIEEVAATNPTAIMYEPIDINKGITKEQAERITAKLGLNNVKDYISNIIMNLYDMFLKKDALLLEVNPLAEDINGNCKFDTCNFFVIYEC